MSFTDSSFFLVVRTTQYLAKKQVNTNPIVPG